MTNGTVRVSVIIPGFNAARFIAPAIQSVLQQSHPPLEIVVVDDGSTDDTERVVRGLSNSIPIVYHRQKNQGLSVARNVAVFLAQGDWIAFLDADDTWYPDKLATQVRWIKEHPAVVFFWSAIDFIDESGRLRPSLNWRDSLAPLIFNHPTIPPVSTVIMRKDVFASSGGFNPLLRCSQDRDLFTRIAVAFPIQFIPESLAQYRCHEGQLHHNWRLRGEDWAILYPSLLKIWHDDPEKRAVLVKTGAALYTHAGKFCLKSGDYAKARWCFRQSFATRPFSWKNLRRWGLSYLPYVRDLYRTTRRKSLR